MHDRKLIPGLHAYPFEFISFLVLDEYPYAGIGGYIVAYLGGGIGWSFDRSGMGGGARGRKLLSPCWPLWSGGRRVSQFRSLQAILGRGGCWIIRAGDFLPWWGSVGQGGRWSCTTRAKHEPTGQ